MGNLSLLIKNYYHLIKDGTRAVVAMDNKDNKDNNK